MTDLERLELILHRALANMNSATDVQAAFEILKDELVTENIRLAQESGK